ncbi:mono-functional DNA-alkylating methyl methanesulfonate N-term-domain-containing protein [Elsinoe ampelina]|uniref:DNA damage-binding protein 1 n=1 Tax=Elsinoe ampelina TaxID=302913 RepID=A0A6A6GMM8_9PEZI|nr:mono-functional DNA-alkylating methyl methanesulfonate N-term-domain-containing protein [Elsinoe ampelina]
MAYIASIHRPSSVRHAIKINFLDAEEDTLVVAKSNRLEFYAQTEDGLVLRHSKAIYGKVILLNKLRPASSTTDHLFVGTDRFMYFVLSWDPTTKQLKTEKTYQDLADNSSRDSQTGDRCLIDPTGRFMALEIYEGIVTVIPIATEGKKKSKDEPGTLRDPIPTRIPELFVRSSAFVHRRKEKDKPQLALLYEDSTGSVNLRIRELDYSPGLKDEGSAEFESPIEVEGDVGLGASHIIPLGAPAYGLLIIGETSISYCDEFEHSLDTKALEEPTIFVAWAQIDSQRFVLADEYGKLYLLMVVLDGRNDYERWQLDVLGETSRASTLVYLDGGRLFVGSHQGDSQVIQIKEQSLEVLQTFSNVAPILDFSVMDMGNRTSDAQVNEYSSGQARIVTGSGAFKDGSLRSVRSGVGLEEIGMIGEMEHITDVFSLRTRPGSQFSDALVVSFLTHTRVFVFSPEGEAEEVESLNGIDMSRQTILAENLQGGEILQVTSSTVAVADPESGMTSASWSTESNGEITAASSARDQVLISVSGTGLVLLKSSPQGLQVVGQRKSDEGSQIACLSLSSLFPNVAFVGYWKASSITLLDLQNLQPLHSETVYEESIVVPRSIVVSQVLANSSPTLFIGMADGNVVTYSVDPSSLQLGAKKSIILGTQQANFKVLPRADGLNNVFAICEHPSLIYGSDGRVVYSAVTAEDARCVCSFDSEAYPGAIAIATDEGLKLALVDEERTTHVQTLPVHETVRRIAYSADLKAFGLGTIKRTLDDNVENIKSHFKLVDQIAFQELDTYALNPDELIECCIRAKLDDGAGQGQLAERFLVGTSYMDDVNDQNVKGRILIFEITEERSIKLIAETALRGACRCLAMCEGRVVAALIKTVVTFTFEYESGSLPMLLKSATYRTSTAPMDIAVSGNVIAIADLMKSTSVVKFTKAQDGANDKLEEIARHYETSWSTAVAEVAEHTYLASDAEGNLAVLSHDVGGVSAEDRRRLRVTSEMLLGEMVNRIRRIDVQPTTGAVVIPRAFMATVEGSIYLFALIAKDKQDFLMRLQERMAELVQSPGNVPFNKYRAFKTSVREAEEPMRFVDGELVERFLDCDTSVQERIVEGLGVDVEDVRGMVENLKRLH